jgi:alpha-beta hydrolase superfamily lysophospholipase
MLSKPFQHLFLIPCLLLLLGCTIRPVTAENRTDAAPVLTSTSFISHDGTELPLIIWQPEDETKFIFVALHGFNDYANFIKRGAQYFTRHNIAVYAYDQRGFGNGPVRGRWGGVEAMAEDLATLIRLIADKHPSIPVYLLGHSMGGAVVIQAMTGDQAPSVAGAILAAPAVWARSTQPFYQNFVLWVGAHTMPWIELTGDSLDRQPSDNIEMLREQGRDPQVIKETRIDTIYGLQNMMDAGYNKAEGFSLPTLVLYGDNDEIIPREPVLDVYHRFPETYPGSKQLILYENGYHMLMRDLQAEKVLQDIVDWVNEQGK